MLTRDDILNALDLPAELVHVPRWGGDVLVRAMPIASPAYVGFVTSSRNGKPISPREEFVRRMVGAVILCALDPETEEPMFRWRDADALREKHWNSILLIATKAFDLAGDEESDEESDEDDPPRGPDREAATTGPAAAETAQEAPGAPLEA